MVRIFPFFNKKDNLIKKNNWEERYFIQILNIPLIQHPINTFNSHLKRL